MLSPVMALMSRAGRLIWHDTIQLCHCSRPPKKKGQVEGGARDQHGKSFRRTKEKKKLEKEFRALATMRLVGKQNVDFRLIEGKLGGGTFRLGRHEDEKEKWGNGEY